MIRIFVTVKNVTYETCEIISEYDEHGKEMYGYHFNKEHDHLIPDRLIMVRRPNGELTLVSTSSIAP